MLKNPIEGQVAQFVLWHAERHCFTYVILGTFLHIMPSFSIM